MEPISTLCSMLSWIKEEAMRSQQGRRGASTRLVMWLIEFGILVALLLFIGFLESMPGLKPLFTKQGAFFIRAFVVVIWALASLYYNDARFRAR